MTDDPSDGAEGSLDPTKSMSGFAVGSDLFGVRQLTLGDVLGGRFTIVQFLARGGMGEVYEAADSHLQNKHCALKMLRSQIAADPVMRQRFARPARPIWATWLSAAAAVCGGTLPAIASRELRASDGEFR